MRLLVNAIVAASVPAAFVACGGAGTERTAAAGSDPALFDTGDPLTCDLAGYASGSGPAATMEQNTLLVTWAGDAGADLRLRLGLEDAAPIVRDLAVRPPAGAWGTLGRDLAPDFRVTSGVRRISYQQLNPLSDLGVEITEEVMDREKWYVFWDAPLLVPGIREGEGRGTNPGLPRSPDEIREANATFNTTSCSVATDGSRLEVTFDGLSMGIFSGDLRFTVYEGTNLVRLEAVASTDEPSVAYKYRGGLQGFSTEHTSRVTWRDISGSPLDYRFGGPTNDDAVPLRAHNRVVIAEGEAGSVAAFPPPVTFFFTREVETNHGYNWYRNDGDGSFAMGVRQGDGETALEGQALAPYGAVPRTDETTAVMGRFFENFALYNAPPGTQQRMAVYFYANPAAAEPTRDSVLAFTHEDTFKPVPGYKTFVNHFHIRFLDRLRASGSLDTPIPDVQALKALGLDIIGLSDFHADQLAAGDSGAARFKDQLDYYEASRRASDDGFLVTPWEEPNAHFGGHYNTLFPKNVYFTRTREPDQPFSEEDPTYGTVYRTRSSEELLQVLEEEDGYWFHAHPRTKGSTGHPDAEIDTPWASMSGSKPAIYGRLKTGHFRRPETGVEIYFTASSVGKVFAGALAVTPEASGQLDSPSSTDRSRSQTCSGNSAVAEPASDSGNASRHSRYCSCNSRSVCTASFHCCGRDSGPLADGTGSGIRRPCAAPDNVPAVPRSSTPHDHPAPLRNGARRRRSAERSRRKRGDRPTARLSSASVYACALVRDSVREVMLRAEGGPCLVWSPG